MELSDAVTSAYFAAFRRLSDAVSPPRREQGRHGVELLLSGVPLPRLNGVYHHRRETDPAEVQRFAAVAAQSGLPWSVQTRAEPTEEIRKIAADLGLTAEEPAPTMVCRPEDLRPAGHETADLTVRVVGSAGHDAFITTMAAGFAMPVELAAETMTPALFDLPGTTAYVGFVEDRPVSIGYSIRSGGLTGVMNIATEPAARHRGYGRKMTEWILRDAFAEGATATYLHASEEGLPLYEAMGFRTVETWTYLS